MKHKWILNEDGKPDRWAFESGYHNGVVCKDCGKSVCVHCHPDYLQMDDCTGPPAPKAITNADRIRAMSDEELSNLLDEWYCMGADGNDQLAYEDARMEWLQKPAEEV